MNARLLAALPVSLFVLSPAGCSVAPGPEDNGSEIASEATACPVPTAEDDQMRAAATLALTLMKDQAVLAATSTFTLAAMSILAPQRYRLLSSGTGIEFDPNDFIYRSQGVNNQMKADLAFAQQDAGVAKLLSDGLKYAYANTDGWVFPRIRVALALDTYTYPGPATKHLYDSTTTANNHYATVTGSMWCGSSVVTISDTVTKSWQYSPFDAQPITAPISSGGASWYSKPPAAFKGKKKVPWTPFNGAVTSGNPYLVVSVNGKATNWTNYNWTPIDCNTLRNDACSGSVEIDPVPYAEPGDYYNTVGVIGTQSNPYSLASTVLFATPDHASQWATRTVNGVQEWGTFTTPVSLFGVTQYRYSKKM